MIHLENINKTYNNGAPLHVLKGIDLTIEKGEFVSIMGASGSGKSTLLNILGILDNYDTGNYYLNGTLIKNLSETQAAEYRNKMIGFVFQSFNLISFKNALENVALPLYYQGISRKKRNLMAMEYLERLGLNEWALHMPNELSGGQKQRLCIARALLKKPKILILDDSTSAVDTATEAQIRKAFREELKDSTKIIIAQRIGSVKDADTIIVMDDGRITGVGTHEELLKNNEEYREICSSQTDGKEA